MTNAILKLRISMKTRRDFETVYFRLHFQVIRAIEDEIQYFTYSKHTEQERENTRHRKERIVKVPAIYN